MTYHPVILGAGFVCFSSLFPFWSNIIFFCPISVPNFRRGQEGHRRGCCSHRFRITWGPSFPLHATPRHACCCVSFVVLPHRTSDFPRLATSGAKEVQHPRVHAAAMGRLQETYIPVTTPWLSGYPLSHVRTHTQSTAFEQEPLSQVSSSPPPAWPLVVYACVTDRSVVPPSRPSPQAALPCPHRARVASHHRDILPLDRRHGRLKTVHVSYRIP